MSLHAREHFLNVLCSVGVCAVDIYYSTYTSYNT